MAQVINAALANKTVADPIAAYESIRPLWEKSRAVCGGERFVKAFDGFIDVNTYTNLLLPFSPSMTQQQYDFYRAEAELPGIVSQYAKMIIGGLLRKQPILELPKDAPPEAYHWIMDGFGQDESPMSAFLDTILWEELQTSRAWVYVDYPKIDSTVREQMTKEEYTAIKPYPVIWNAESIISWKMCQTFQGAKKLERVILRGWIEDYSRNEWHPDLLDTLWVHELVEDKYQIRIYQKPAPDLSVPVVNGKKQQQYDTQKPIFTLKETIQDILVNGERLTFIPAWPLNGSVDANEPILTALIDKEVGLYNKMSRRNHLLYGASTYTPVISSDISDDDFDNIVNGGLGSWIRLRQGDTASVLETPTAALQDMDRAIASAIEEMAKMGIKMLTPEVAQSGVALEIRNAAQSAQLGTLNNKVSNTMADIICFMINWRYDTQYKSSDIEFNLSADFNPTPLGADWLRLATEWYQQGMIPRSVWLQILKINDIIPPDYDDEEGKLEINEDEMLMAQKQVGTASYTAQLQMQEGLDPAAAAGVSYV